VTFLMASSLFIIAPIYMSYNGIAVKIVPAYTKIAFALRQKRF